MMELNGVAGPSQLGLHSLPPELVYLIANYLRLRDIKEISITCRAYRRTVIPMLFNRIRASDRLTHNSNLSELTSSVWFVKDATRHITLEYFHGIPRFPSNAKHALRAQLRLFPCLTSLSIFFNDARFSLHILRDLRTILQCISKLSLESVKLTLIARRYDTTPTAPRSLPPLPPLKSLAIIWDIEPDLPRPSESYVAAMVDRCKESLRNFTLAINANHFLHTDLSTVIPQLSHVSQLSLLGFGSFSLAMFQKSFSRLPRLQKLCLTSANSWYHDDDKMLENVQSLTGACPKLSCCIWMNPVDGGREWRKYHITIDRREGRSEGSGEPAITTITRQESVVISTQLATFGTITFDGWRL